MCELKLLPYTGLGSVGGCPANDWPPTPGPAEGEGATDAVAFALRRAKGDRRAGAGAYWCAHEQAENGRPRHSGHRVSTASSSSDDTAGGASTVPAPRPVSTPAATGAHRASPTYAADPPAPPVYAAAAAQLEPEHSGGG